MSSLFLAGILEFFAMSIEMFLYATHVWIWKKLDSPYSRLMRCIFLSCALFALGNMIFGLIGITGVGWQHTSAKIAGNIQMLGAAGLTFSLTLLIWGLKK